MDNLENNDRPEERQSDSEWLDELFSKPLLGEEIHADEHAMLSAGLTHPDDLELDQIMQEAISENWGSEEPAAPADAASPEISDMPENPEVVDPANLDVTRLFSIDLPAFEDFPTDSSASGQEVEKSSDASDDHEIIAEYEDAPELPEEEEEDEEPEEEAPPVRKRRPKHKKGYGLFGIPHILATVVWLAIILAIGVSFGRILWVCAADVLAFGRDEQEIVVTITENDTVETVANKLHAAGLVRYPQLFKLYADLTHAEEDIEPGTYTLNTIYDYHALVNSMSAYSDFRETVTLMIPEGYTCAQIFELLEARKVCSVEKLEEYAANGDLDDYWFLEGVNRGDRYCLEGYLFPDTYEFYTDDSPRRVLEKLLDGFDYRFTDTMKAKLDTLNEHLAEMMADNGYDEDYIADNLVTIREITIIASMIEKEKSSNPLDGYAISSVIYNRLTNAREFPFLNIDATLVYALSLDGIYHEILTDDDKAIDSPYNTYTEIGLIPGPISNPGQSSLNAALDPDDADYYYYAYDPNTGTHHYSESYDEHIEFLQSLEDEDDSEYDYDYDYDDDEYYG